MKYISTRDSHYQVTGAQAVVMGIAPDSGLFVPEEIPQINTAFLTKLIDKSYIERAAEVLNLYFDEFTHQELLDICEKSYLYSFEDNVPAPISKLNDSTYIMELWHGPTCAFKDLALQFLPHFIVACAEKINYKQNLLILTATSGDTGKAALEGFKDVDGIKIAVFFPKDGVSTIQKLQMQTQEGNNVYVAQVEGNFDVVQSQIKELFTSSEFSDGLKELGYTLTSANSINWGRLAPQIVYYISAYVDLIKEGEIKLGDSINVCVPTGNFGNILAGLYAKKMGVPIERFICASNANHVLTDFIQNGTYDIRREFVTTNSPSMDILISSNLERFLYQIENEDDRVVGSLMKELKDNKSYHISSKAFEELKGLLSGYYCDEKTTEKEIYKIYKTYGYLSDTHSAVAINAYEQYLSDNKDSNPTLIVSTASPYKFSSSVLKSLDMKINTSEFDNIASLEKISKIQAPDALKNLSKKKIKFPDVISVEQMGEKVIHFVK